MNLKVLFMIIVYYSLVSMVFLFGGDIFLDDYEVNVNLNETALGVSETDTGGLFSTGVSFSRFFLWVGFGVGLPDDTPGWFTTMFVLWQTIVTLLTIGFIISSIWDG